MNIHNLTIEHIIDNDTGSAQIRDASGRLWLAHKTPSFVIQRKHNKLHCLRWWVHLPEGLLWNGKKKTDIENDLGSLLSFISEIANLT